MALHKAPSALPKFPTGLAEGSLTSWWKWEGRWQAAVMHLKDVSSNFPYSSKISQFHDWAMGWPTANDRCKRLAALLH